MDFKKIMSEMLDSLKKNEIDISTEFNNNSEITDKSKIGGRPYLPEDFIWPYYQGFPLSFLTQWKPSRLRWSPTNEVRAF